MCGHTLTHSVQLAKTAKHGKLRRNRAWIPSMPPRLQAYASSRAQPRIPWFHGWSVTRPVVCVWVNTTKSMAESFESRPITASVATHAAFSMYLQSHPNKRRVTRNERDELVGWLANHHAPPSSQKEFNRRNYVQKAFTWDDDSQTLTAILKRGGGTRKVIIEDCIIDVVELVHTSNGHARWDATWRDVSQSYYGIMRADVIFLLKRCETCESNPRKRPKGSTWTRASPDGAVPDT